MDRPAQTTVLGIPELVELILLELDHRDLITTAQRICQQWKAIVCGPLLQRKLYPPSSSAVRFNVLLRDVFPICYPKDGLDRSQAPFESDSYLSALFSRDTFVSNTFAELDWATTEEKTVAYQRSEASWRKWMVSLPPPKNIRVVTHVSTQGGSIHKEVLLKEPDGLTMGFLYDLVVGNMYGRVKNGGVYWDSMTCPVQDRSKSDEENSKHKKCTGTVVSTPQEQPEKEYKKSSEDEPSKPKTLSLEDGETITVKFRSVAQCTMGGPTWGPDRKFFSHGYKRVKLD